MFKKINKDKKTPRGASQKKRAPLLFGVGKEKQLIIENLGVLVSSGVNIPAGLEAIKSEVRSKALQRVLDQIITAITTGSFVWQAFQESRLFSDDVVALVRIGEESGRLTENLAVVAEQQKKNREFQARIKSAMLYPVFVLILTTVLGIGIAWFILPKLALIFSQLRLDLPTITHVLISIGGFLQDHGNWVIPLVLAVFATKVYFLFFFKKTRYIGQELLFLIPGVHRLVRDMELARFGFLLGSLLETGMLITHAMASVEQSTLFPRYQKLYAHLRESISEGYSIRESLRRYPKSERAIPPSIQQIIISGEQSGHLAQSFREIGRAAEVRTENATKNLAVILEPVLLVIVWLGVVGVAFAVVMPIYQLVGGISF